MPCPSCFMFQHEGVPPLMVMDGSKEQTLGKFCQKLCDAGCEKRTIEPYSHWQNAAEQEIEEPRKVLVGSYSLPTCPGDSAMIVWNMKPL